MRNLLFALACLLGIQSVGFAQVTWGGLTFAASLEETRNYLMMHGAELERRDASWNIRQGWDFMPPGYPVVLHFAPRLYFSADDRLERVLLNLTDAGGDPRIAVTSIREQLIGKYGPPATETPGCAAIDVGQGEKPSEVICRAIWMGVQQVI